MAKLMSITRTQYEMIDNAQCDHCDVYIDNTERYCKQGYMFWCNECIDEDYGTIDAVLKSIDDDFKYLPATYYDASKSTITYPDGKYTFTLKQEKRKRRYYWWMSNQYADKIRAIPKRKEPRTTHTYTGLMIRETTDSKHYCWHTPKESAEAIKPDPIVFINKPITFIVRWSDGTSDTYIDGARS